jgi:hypothetical protein
MGADSSGALIWRSVRVGVIFASAMFVAYAVIVPLLLITRPSLPVVFVALFCPAVGLGAVAIVAAVRAGKRNVSLR